MKRNLFLMYSLFLSLLLVSCDENSTISIDHLSKIAALEEQIDEYTVEIKEKEAEIVTLKRGNKLLKGEIEELQQVIEEYKSPYYVGADSKGEVSKGNERLDSYAFIIKGIANRISHIDDLIEENDYNNAQLKILQEERDYVWELWLAWKDKQKELMDEMELSE